MAFVPRLPSWPIHVQRYRYEPVTDSWSAVEDWDAQIYNPLRGQDDDVGGMTYLMYPKEDDYLVDSISYGGIAKADAIVAEFPTGSGKLWAWIVRDVAPRWLGFPNEHLIATLVRQTPYMFAVITGATPPAPAGNLLFTWETVTNTPGGFGGTIPWVDIGGNIWEAVFDSANLRSESLLFSGRNPGLNLPPTAIVRGIEIPLARSQPSGQPAIGVADMIAMCSNSFFPNWNGALPGFFPELFSDPQPNHGGPTDEWDWTWPPAQINAGDIFFEFVANCDPIASGTITAQVSMTNFRVYYDMP